MGLGFHPIAQPRLQRTVRVLKRPGGQGLAGVRGQDTGLAVADSY